MQLSKSNKSSEVAQIEEVAEYLRSADRLVRKGRYSEALAEVQKAKNCNPRNFYALAYEKRILSLLPGNETTVPFTSQLSEIDRETSKTRVKDQYEQDIRQKIAEEENRKIEEKRQVVLRKKVYDLLLKARELSEKKEFKRALNVIARIYIIDPLNENAIELEKNIRESQNKNKVLHHQEEQKQYDRSENVSLIEIDSSKPNRHEGKVNPKIKEKQTGENEILIDPIRMVVNRAKQYLIQENFGLAQEEVRIALQNAPDNKDLNLLYTIIKDAEKQRKKVEMLWEELGSFDNRSMNGRMEIKHRYKEELAGYYEKLDEVLIGMDTRVHTSDKLELNVNGGENGTGVSENHLNQKEIGKEPQPVNLEEEIRKVYTAWQKEREQANRIERETVIQEHIQRAYQFLQSGLYDDALAEVAYAKIKGAEPQKIEKLENEIWTIWDDKTGKEGNEDAPLHDSEILSEDVRRSKCTMTVKTHIRNAENFIEKKEYASALDEVAKAYIVDPLNSDIKDLETMIRRLQGKSKEKYKKLFYPPVKRVG